MTSRLPFWDIKESAPSLHCFISTSPVSSRAHRVTAPVDGKVDAGNEAGSIGCQEGDAVCHFLHLPRSAQGVRLLTPLQELVAEKTDGSVLPGRAASVLLYSDSFPLITAAPSRWRTTAMGFMWERHWLDALPACTAARLGLLSCGHLWWWRRGWGGRAKAATLVRSQILNSKQCVDTHGRLPLTTQSSPSLAYSPALKRIHFHFNYICQCLWCRTCSRRRKNNFLTEGCTTSELIDGRLGHAVSQHTGELQQEKQGGKVQQHHTLLKKTPKSQRPDA